MPRVRSPICLVVFAALACLAPPARAVTITIDYRYDDMGNQFFGANNPQGATGAAQARAALQAAADFYSDILDDTLLAIESPLFEGENGFAYWRWTAKFTNPNTGFGATLINDAFPPDPPPPLPIAANEYVIFVGARFLSGNAIASASPGVVSSFGRFESGTFTPAERNLINNIENQFHERATHRGEDPANAVSWGGSLTFDNDPEVDWNFDHLLSPSGEKFDFYTVAIHEIAHVLGFGVFPNNGDPTVWQSLVSGTEFVGSTAMSIHGGPVPLESTSDRSHWKGGLASKVYDGTAMQTPVMSSDIPPNIRRHLTDLDAAALIDLGWELDLPMPPPTLPGDYNGNGVVDAADYTVWRDSLGQTGSNLPANGDNSGASANRIDQADYDFWAARFGNTLPSGAGSLAGGAISGVPEPSSIVMVTALGFFCGRRRRRSHFR